MPAGTVLIIDDDAGLRAFVATALEEDGYAAVAVPDVAAGLVVLGALLVDLILLDHGTGPLPDGAFIQAARHRAPAGPRILLWTGWHDAAARALAVGADGALEKPTDLDALLGRIRREIGAP